MARFAIFTATLLLGSSVRLLEAKCSDDLKKVDAEIGIIQTISDLTQTDATTKKTNGELLTKTLGALADSLPKTFKSAVTGVAGFAGYKAGGDKDKATKYCDQKYSELQSDTNAVDKVIDGMIAGSVKAFPPTNLDPTNDSSLTAALMALSQMKFSSPTAKKGNFRVLVVQSDRQPTVAPATPVQPFKGDGSDTCDTDAPSLAQAKKILTDHDAYLAVVAQDKVKDAWTTICKTVERCVVTSASSLYTTDIAVFSKLLTDTFCLAHPDKTSSSTSPTPTSSSDGDSTTGEDTTTSGGASNSIVPVAAVLATAGFYVF